MVHLVSHCSGHPREREESNLPNEARTVVRVVSHYLAQTVSPVEAGGADTPAPSPSR